MLRDPHSECVILLHCCGDLGGSAGGGEGKEEWQGVDKKGG
jgi:hypothetical protein